MHLDRERRSHRGAPCRVGAWSAYSTCQKDALLREAVEANAQDGCTCDPTFVVMHRYGRPSGVRIDHDPHCSIFAPA